MASSSKFAVVPEVAYIVLHLSASALVSLLDRECGGEDPRNLREARYKILKYQPPKVLPGK